MTPRTIELGLAGVMDSLFETIGLLLKGRRGLAQSFAIDDQEQVFKQQHLARIMAVPRVYQDDLLVSYFRFEALDKAQRAATQDVDQSVGQAADYARTGNGLLERAMDGLRQLCASGKRKGRAP